MIDVRTIDVSGAPGVVSILVVTEPEEIPERLPARSGDPGRPLSALPSPIARIVAFSGILAGGLAGGFIGYALVGTQCTGNCGAAKGWGLLIGAVAAALGMAVVAVLGLRAMGEWNEVLDRERAGHAPS